MWCYNQPTGVSLSGMLLLLVMVVLLCSVVWSRKKWARFLVSVSRPHPRRAFLLHRRGQIFTTEGFLHLTMPENLMGSGGASAEASRGDGGPWKGARSAEPFATAFRDPGLAETGEMPLKVCCMCVLWLCVFFVVVVGGGGVKVSPLLMRTLVVWISLVLMVLVFLVPGVV